jgi:hypothetical protein
MLLKLIYINGVSQTNSCFCGVAAMSEWMQLKEIQLKS